MVSCTLVKCKHNDGGKVGKCQLKEVQIGGYVDPSHKEVGTLPLCALYQKEDRNIMYAATDDTDKKSFACTFDE